MSARSPSRVSSSYPLITTPPSVPRDPVSVIDQSPYSEQGHIFESLADHHSRLSIPHIPLHSSNTLSSLVLPPIITTRPFENYHFPAKRISPLKSVQRLISPLRQHSLPFSSLSLSPEAGRPRKKSRVEMNMAQNGSLAALPGIQTPLASYAAHMVVWLWYGHFTAQPDTSPALSVSSATSIPVDPFNPFSQPKRISSLMVRPSAEFSNFVARLLQVTMVSHSVTVLALLYVYRLKMQNSFSSTPGSEHRPFVAALILGNKYLDDNTYTNATWSELAGISLEEINRMETEFLVGLHYELGVEVSEYERWKMLLDEFMLSRGLGNLMPSGRTKGSSQSPYPSHPGCSPSYSPKTRARSASPPRIVPSRPAHMGMGEPARKRSAADAFYHQPVPALPAGHNLQIPSVASPTHTSHTLPPSRSRPAMVSQESSSSLARSASLSRRLARLPAAYSNAGRRGSAGHVYPTPNPPAEMIRHHQQPASTSYEQMIPPDMRADWGGGRALLAPYDDNLPQPHLVPPEHLMFYSLAAEAHPGADGQPRKAILRCHEPAHSRAFGHSPVDGSSYNAQAPYDVYQARPPPPAHCTEDVAMYDANPGIYRHSPSGRLPPQGSVPPPFQSSYPRSYYRQECSPTQTGPEPEPAQFANAGPPGYEYNPYGPGAVRWEGGARWPIAASGWDRASHGTLYHPSESITQRLQPAWTSRSEWSSPAPRYHA